MSYFNGTLPSSNVWSGYLTHAQTQLSEHSRLILILVINAPVIAIILNIVGQLVNTFLYTNVMYWLIPLTPSRSYRKERQTLLLFSIGFLLLVQRFNMVTTHWIFFSNVRKRFNSWSFMKRDRFPYLLIQYGNVFTFILLGRRVTVALGIKGNNFILGGKSTVFNAEDAYKVYHYRMLDNENFILFVLLSLASHYTYLWQGCRLRCC